MKKLLTFGILLLLCISLVNAIEANGIRIELGEGQSITKTPTLLEQSILSVSAPEQGSIMVFEDTVKLPWYKKIFQQQSIIFGIKFKLLQEGIAYNDLTADEKSYYNKYGYLPFDPTTDSRYKPATEVAKDVGTTNTISGKKLIMYQAEIASTYYDSASGTLKKSTDPSLKQYEYLKDSNVIPTWYIDKNTQQTKSSLIIAGRTMFDFRSLDAGGSPYTKLEKINYNGQSGFLLDDQVFVPSKLGSFDEFIDTGIGEYALDALKNKSTTTLAGKYGSSTSTNLTIDPNSILVFSDIVLKPLSKSPTQNLIENIAKPFKGIYSTFSKIFK